MLPSGINHVDIKQMGLISFHIYGTNWWILARDFMVTRQKIDKAGIDGYIRISKPIIIDKAGIDGDIKVS